jgi:hypothetical protein
VLRKAEEREHDPHASELEGDYAVNRIRCEHDDEKRREQREQDDRGEQKRVYSSITCSPGTCFNVCASTSPVAGSMSRM